MSNDLLTPTVILKEGMRQLDNNLIAGKLVYRDYESEFGDTKVGDTVQIRRPVNWALRQGNVANVQDAVEGKLDIVVDQLWGVDMAFPSTDLTLTIERFSERYIKPAAIKIANKIDSTVWANYYKFPNWVGTPGTRITTFAGFSKAPERMDELSMGTDDRFGALNPSDYWGMLPELKGLFLQDRALTALERAKVGLLGNVDTYMSQNMPTHTVGALGGTPLVDGAGQISAYTAVKNTMTQTLLLKGASNSITAWMNAGDVFTLAGVYDVNPVTKATLPFLKMFSCQAAVNSGSGGAVSMTIYPAIISSTTDPYQNVSAAPADGAAVTVIGTAATGYRQNLACHKNALALTMVPLELPQAAVVKERQTHKGLSLRLVSGFDVINNKTVWRLEGLWGAQAIDQRLGVRVSGT